MRKRKESPPQENKKKRKEKITNVWNTHNNNKYIYMYI